MVGFIRSISPEQIFESMTIEQRLDTYICAIEMATETFRRIGEDVGVFVLMLETLREIKSGKECFLVKK